MEIDKVLKSSERLDYALERLEEFEKMMELIERYPLKSSEPLLPSPPYEPTNSSCYNF